MYENKTVLIMGLGLHGGGVGAVNYFSSIGARVIVTDLKTGEELAESIDKIDRRDRVDFVLGGHRYEDFESADLVIKNPGVPVGSPYLAHARQHGIPIETDIGIFLQEIKGVTNNVVGVTGTKGKSTTATLFHAIVHGCHPDALIGGNITGSVLQMLPRVKKDTYVILELSSFQLGGIAPMEYSPHVGIFTNFMEDHLNYYGGMEEYFRDKSVLYRFQKEGDLLVVNREDAAYELIDPPSGTRVISFGLDGEFEGEGSYVEDGTVFYRSRSGTFPVMRVSSITLPGSHNLYNVLAAVAAACCAGFGAAEIESTVKRFHGIAHRLEYVGSRGGVGFYNDSAATIPRAAIEGINSFEGHVTLVAGGSDKKLVLIDFIRTIEEKVAVLHLLEGSGTQRLIDCGLKKAYSLHSDLSSAVHAAFRSTPPGGTVLLSPGFASFGMFKNEFHRGREFVKIVLGIPE